MAVSAGWWKNAAFTPTLTLPPAAFNPPFSTAITLAFTRQLTGGRAYAYVFPIRVGRRMGAHAAQGTPNAPPQPG